MRVGDWSSDLCSSDLDGAAHLDFRPEGLQCHLELAMYSETMETAAEERRLAVLSAEPELQGIAGRRILVVEDTTLVAMEIEEAIQAAGGTVVGPTGDRKSVVEGKRV